MQISKSREKEVRFNSNDKTINYRKTCPNKKIFNLCIISTSADIRSAVTINLLNSCVVQNIIFEKVVFQKEQDFEIISKLLIKNKINAWVNCPRRMFSTYKTIKQDLDITKPLKMSVKGANWGMACNAIHFIDLFSFLVNDSSLQVTKAIFNNNILKNHRSKKFYEVNGLINFKIGIHTLLISCNTNKSPFLKVDIKNDQKYYKINELEGLWESKSKGSLQIHHYETPYQSDLTGKLIDNLIYKNDCELVTYNDSTLLHIPFLKVIKAHLSKTLKKNLTTCPIT